MAHERIYVDSYAPGEPVPDRRMGVMIQWLADGEQVGVGTGLQHEDPEDVESGSGVRQDMFMIWLDRRDINHLIRVLRRARNVACGADE